MTNTRPNEEGASEPLPLPAQVNPDSCDSFNSLMVVNERADGSYFKSWAESKVDLPAGAVFARISGITPTSKQDYATTQSGPNMHFVFNSDLYYCNHSCAPSLECDTSTWEIRVSRKRPLRKGDVLSLFYPSTEWTMDREFECWCGAGKGICCGIIKGARDMDDRDLERYWLNDFIHELRKQETRPRNSLEGYRQRGASSDTVSLVA